MTDQPQKYLTSEDLADILQLSVKTIYNRVSLIENHKAKVIDLLPTISRLPGTAGPRWTPRAVAQWQARYDTERTPEKRRVGRPTKAETIARRLSQSVATN